MMIVHFMKNCPLNGTSLATRSPSLQAQVEYMNSFPSFEVEVNTVRLGEPLRIARSLSEMVDYSYGWITYDDSGYRYYFYVVDLAMITETQTEVRYNIDTYETLVRQTGIEFKNVHLLNAPASVLEGLTPADDNITWMKHVIVPEPATWNITAQRDGGPVNSKGELVMDRKGFLLATGYGDEVYDPKSEKRGAHTWTILYRIEDIDDMRDALNGQWFSKIRANILISENPKKYAFNPVLLSQSDIYYACFVPTDLKQTESSLGDEGWTRLYSDTEGKLPSGWFSIDKRSESIDKIMLTSPPDTWHGLLIPSISSTLTERQSITDARGNVVWECPVGSEYTIERGSLEWTATSANIVLSLESKVGRFEQGEVVVTDKDSVTIIIPCETIDLFQSSWLEYFYRQRESDRALRQIQMTQQLASAGLGAASSAGMGGAYSGRGGAQSAFGGEAISALGGWLVQSISDPFTQKVLDRQAKRQADPLLLAGSMTEEIFLHNHFGKTVREMDVASKQAYIHRYDTLGYDCDIYLMYDPIRVNNDGSGNQCFRGYFHCYGRAPRQWLAEIEQRLAEGVQFI